MSRQTAVRTDSALEVVADRQSSSAALAKMFSNEGWNEVTIVSINPVGLPVSSTAAR